MLKQRSLRRDYFQYIAVSPFFDRSSKHVEFDENDILNSHTMCKCDVVEYFINRMEAFCLKDTHEADGIARET